MIIEHAILRNVDSDCDAPRRPYYDYEIGYETEAADLGRALWNGCGTKTVSEVAMVQGVQPKR